MATTKENKGTRAFNDTIKAYLEERAENDALFAVRFANPSKSVEECVTFILNEVKKSGCCGFTDAEVYGMAIHYYDEEEIEVGKPINCQVVVNHTVELTEEERNRHRTATSRRRSRSSGSTTTAIPRGSNSGVRYR